MSHWDKDYLIRLLTTTGHRVTTAAKKWGPTDDGTPAGKALELALIDLAAAVAFSAKQTAKRKRGRA